MHQEKIKGNEHAIISRYNQCEDTYRRVVRDDPEADNVGDNCEDEDMTLHRLNLRQMVDDLQEDQDLRQAEEPALWAVLARVAIYDGLRDAQSLRQHRQEQVHSETTMETQRF